MQRTGTLLVAAVSAAVATSPASAGPPPAADPAGASAAAVRVVRLEGFKVRPDTIRVRRGATVEWRFLDDPAPHNVTSRGKQRFRSSPSQRSGTHRVRFRRSGTYRYVCTIHFNMRGRVVVG